MHIQELLGLKSKEIIPKNIVDSRDFGKHTIDALNQNQIQVLIALVGIWSVAKRKAREEFFKTAKNSFAQQALRNTELFLSRLISSL